MTTSSKELLECLENELDARKGLLSSLFEMNDAIRRCDSKKLQIQLTAQKEMLGSIANLANRRTDITLKMAENLQVKETSQLLDSISKTLHPMEKSQVQTMRQQLQQTCQETQLMNQDNEVLLKSGLDIVETMLSTLMHEGASTRIYGEKGSPSPKQTKRSLFETQA